MNIKLVKIIIKYVQIGLRYFVFPLLEEERLHTTLGFKNERQSNRLSDSTSRKGREDYGEAI